MKDIKIKDLYAGKPDAKDEINFDGYDRFIRTFVLADHFNLDLLTKGSHCFITGFKGTGKTALLFYIDELIRRDDTSSCSSFIFFKEDYTDVRRDELQEISKRVQSSVSVEPGALSEISEFEYIWRWIFYKQIVSDNDTYGRNLFCDDDKWRTFEKLISHIKDPHEKRKILLPNKIKAALPVKDPATLTEVTPEIEIDLRDQESKHYRDFITLIDKADDAFSCVTRTDIPYFVFVDELEAYYGDKTIFTRDLNMIRDLIFTVKRFNSIFAKANMEHTKIICSVRNEIVTAISRFIVTKEINKVISGFSVPLIWNYTNSNSYAHPIMQILLKRIAICSECEDVPSLDLYRKWFPENIHDMEPANYILNNSWCKPRDIVRLISTAQNSLHNNSNCFSYSVFSSLSKAYSEDSLQEIKEELRALYSAEEIDSIVSCFTGFKTSFSINELRVRIEKYFKGSVIDLHFNNVLNDLYRLGFLGNFLPVAQTYRWQHRGDSALIMSEEWRLFVHYALHGALSIGSRADYGLNRGKAPQKGDISIALVRKVLKSMALVEFKINGVPYRGKIHISEFGRNGYGFIQWLPDVVKPGESFNIIVNDYDEEHSNWSLSINPNLNNLS